VAVASKGKVVAVETRGLGGTEPRDGRERRGSPFGAEFKEAFMAIHLDRPLLGQRVLDLLTVLEGLDAESGEGGHNGFELVGHGSAGPIVLHAALLDRRGLIKRVRIDHSVVSWSDVVRRGISRDQLGNVVPGVLEAYDLPDLAARLAPRGLAISEAVDAEGHPVPQDVLDRAYAACVEAYRSGGELKLRAAQNPGPSR
jgi:hypothetical protein